MARGYKQRFDVTRSTAGPVNPSPSQQSDALNAMSEAERRAVEDFRKGLITADDALAEFASAMRQFGRTAGFTIDQRQKTAAGVEYTLDQIAKETGAAGVSKDVPEKTPDEQLREKLDDTFDRFRRGMIGADEAAKTAAGAINRLGEAAGYTAEERAKSAEKFEEMVGGGDRARLQQAFDDAVEKFSKGLIDADEAVRRQTAAVNKFGEGLGLTLEEQKAMKKEGFEDVQDEARLTGQEGPADPNNPLTQILKSVGGKFGLSPDMMKNITGSLGCMGGLGGGAGGLMSSLGSAAGPLAIVAAGSKVMEGFYDGIADTTRKITSVGTKIAGNDGFGAITEGIEGAASTITSKIPVLGDAMQAQVEMYTQFIKSFDVITEAFRARGEELSRFDGNIAAASAESKVTKLLADINEAQRLGNEYAAVIREKAEIQVEFQRALEPIKAAMMQQLIPIMRGVTALLKSYNDGAEKLGKDITRIREVGNKVLGPLSELSVIGQIFKLLKQFAPQRDAKGDNVALATIMKFLNEDISVEDERMAPAVEQVPFNIDLFK